MPKYVANQNVGRFVRGKVFDSPATSDVVGLVKKGFLREVVSSFKDVEVKKDVASPVVDKPVDKEEVKSQK